VSVFRPAVRLTAPDGREWEIYAYRIAVGGRAEWDTDVVDVNGLYNPGAAGFALLNAMMWIVMLVPRLLVRLFDAGVAALHALRSDQWTIEAITFMPQRQSYVWRTTSEYRGQVLAQVEGNLASGHVPQRLRNATYLGWRRSAR
jgi:hypothetical protein